MENRPLIKATKRLIDSVWTLGFKFVSPTEVEIVSYNRDDVDGYENEKTYQRCNLIEDKKRIVIGLVLDNYEGFNYWAKKDSPTAKTYVVVNPEYIFSYVAPPVSEFVPETINVIEIDNGSVSNIKSFTITKADDRDKIVTEAESYFSTKLLSKGVNTEDIESYIEDGSYQCTDGYLSDYKLQIFWN